MYAIGKHNTLHMQVESIGSYHATRYSLRTETCYICNKNNMYNFMKCSADTPCHLCMDK